MATRSRIGIDEGDGCAVSIYCHWDGYPAHVGRILLDHYTEESKVRELLDLGDLSILGPEIGEAHDFDTHGTRWDGANRIETESTPWCLAYGRDRGETDVAAEAHSLDAWPDSGDEYCYLFTAEGWQVSDQGGPWEPLASHAEIVEAVS